LKLSIVGGAAALLLLALPGAALAEDLTFTLTNNSPMRSRACTPKRRSPSAR